MAHSNLGQLEEILGIRFSDRELLREALTHSSVSAAGDTAQISYDRLEFLGDSVLGLVVTDFLYRRFPKLNEGELTQLRASLVKAEQLARTASDLTLGDYLVLGKGAEATGGRKRASILEGCLEAVIGAIYLDRGLDAARRFVLTHLKDTIMSRAATKEYRDYKTILQEYTMDVDGTVPNYTLTREEGLVHDRTFHTTVEVMGKIMGEGSGKSKKEAEQLAAKAALSELQGDVREE